MPYLSFFNILGLALDQHRIYRQEKERESVAIEETAAALIVEMMLYSYKSHNDGARQITSFQERVAPRKSTEIERVPLQK